MTELTTKEGAALRILRAQPIAPLPRAIINANGIHNLAAEGLIERSGIPGFWAITDAGRAIDLATAVVDRNDFGPRHTWWIDPTPDSATAALLEHEFGRLDGVMPGDELFGRVVRSSTLDFLSGRSTESKFVYFAYPVGFAAKHIAWAVRNKNRLWTDHNVNCKRGELGLPATRWLVVKKERETKRAEASKEQSLRAELEASGAEPWEIEEYFAMRGDGRVVL